MVGIGDKSGSPPAISWGGEAANVPTGTSLPPDADLRRRNIRFGLYVVLAIQGLSLVRGSAPAGLRAVNLATILFSCLCLWSLTRGGDLLRLGRVVSTGFVVAVMAASVVHIHNGWPAALNFVPLLVAYATLIGGVRTALANLFLAFATMASAYLLFAVPHPPFLAIQVVNWVTASTLLFLILWRLAAALGQGTAELSATTEALSAAEAASKDLSRVLSGRVTQAVDELAAALRERPKTAPTLARVLRTELEEGRARVPAEPPLCRMTLGDRLAHLRTTVLDAFLGLLVLASVVAAIRVTVIGPAELASRNYAQLGVVAGMLILRFLRPRWRFWLLGSGMVCFAALLPGFLNHWYAAAPISPPNLPIILMAAVIAGLTLGHTTSGLLLLEFTVLSLLDLKAHPGIHWTAPVNLALATAGLTWVMAKWPRDLLSLLHQRHGEALARIREQRRLIATLFHDLANPLQAVVAWAENLEHGEATPEDLPMARDMVARMQGILTAVYQPNYERTALAARPLCEALASMFRDRLASKKLRLTFRGEAEAPLMANESLLRDSVLANLVSNAIKFSPPGADIDVRIEQDGRHAILRIEDRGPGLPKDVLSAFSQGQRAPSHHGTAGEVGSGYGLLLAREHVEGMGGTLDFCAREGGGLCAQVALPLAKNAA